MDKIINLEDIHDKSDDEVQLVEDTDYITQGTAPTFDHSSTVETYKGKKPRENDTETSQGKKARKNENDVKDGQIDAKKTKSPVWDYFDKIGLVDGVEKARCNHCRSNLTCRVGSGTTHLRRHIEGCLKTPRFHDVGALMDNQANLLKKWKFDTKAYREGLARAIIKHDLPFNYAEYEGVNEMNKIINPEFKPVCRNTAKDDCLKVFEVEKQKLKSMLAAHRGRICLTSDCWTALNSRGYMSVTAHFIDSKWKLNSKLLAFCELDTSHSGLELSSKLLSVLKDWGIESKVFSLTLDNARSNDGLIKYLRDRLNLQDGLLCKGEFLHVRCCAHILNLIVQDGLKVVDTSLNKIRESVKYVRASDGRLRDFQKCIDEVNLSDVGGSFLIRDVFTRWNSTYLMLESAIKYRRAFTSLSYNDTHYKHCPTAEEWERGERICSFLAPFYKITNLISGSSYPTSNLYFKQISTIEMKLNELLGSQDEVIREMATQMKAKFAKYWESYCTTLAFGSVLDPKSKMKYLTFVYKKLYPNDYQAKVKVVGDSLYKLFKEYEQLGGTSRSIETSMTNSSVTVPLEELDEYDKEYIEESLNIGKSELDVYLEESVGVVNTLDAIEYWKVNVHRFPRLSLMASDVLSIPITTVASESTFSIGGRILNKYRNCLLSKNVQALICTRNWLHGFKASEDANVQDDEEIQISNQGSNDVDAA